jgi:hypothetical protein
MKTLCGLTDHVVIRNPSIDQRVEWDRAGLKRMARDVHPHARWRAEQRRWPGRTRHPAEPVS